MDEFSNEEAASLESTMNLDIDQTNHEVSVIGSEGEVFPLSNALGEPDLSTESSSLLPAIPASAAATSDEPATEESATPSTETASESPFYPEVNSGPPQACAICGKTQMDDGRAMVRFLPTLNAPSDISLHIFCGKTASILGSQPEYEILLKAGLKNKHGIGPDVNFALAQSRSAIAQGGEAEKDPKRFEKEYYLVKEFEGHLLSMRHAHTQRVGTIRASPFVNAMSNHLSSISQRNAASKRAKAKAAAQRHRKKKVAKANKTVAKAIHHHPPEQEWMYVHDPITMYGQPAPEMNTTPEGKVKCPCGGSYWPTGSSKGVSSWRAHVQTKKHSKWMSSVPSTEDTCNDAYSESNQMQLSPEKMEKEVPDASLDQIDQHVGSSDEYEKMILQQHQVEI